MSAVMETTNNPSDLSAWVDASVATLDDPHDEAPDPVHVLARLRERVSISKNRRRTVRWSLLTAVGMVLIAFALPTTRAMAQRFLAAFTATRFDVLSASGSEFDALPVSVRGLLKYPQPAETPSASLSEATRIAGFVPHLPRSLRDPKLSTTAPITTESTIHVAELLTALDLAGAGDVVVPPDWDGSVVVMQASAGIGALYKNENIYLAQRLPLTWSTSPDLPLGEFMEVLFRIVGIEAAEAAELRNRFDAGPGDFLHIAPRYDLQPRKVQLQTGPALLLKNFRGEKVQGWGLMLIWSTPDRCYFLSGSLTEAEIIAIANSIRPLGLL
jgi:hypothetical protein